MGNHFREENRKRRNSATSNKKVLNQEDINKKIKIDDYDRHYT